jgi:lipoprotein-releasing system permease protein
LSYLAGRYHWVPLNQEVYSVAYLPLNPHWQDGIWIAATAIFISFIATLYPARNATRIAPVEALRYE